MEGGNARTETNGLDGSTHVTAARPRTAVDLMNDASKPLGLILNRNHSQFTHVVQVISVEAPVPRYYFDVDDGKRKFVDDESSEMRDTKAARDEAVLLLPDFAKTVLPDGGDRDFVSRVRDEAGTLIFEATFTLRSQWLADR